MFGSECARIDHEEYATLTTGGGQGYVFHEGGWRSGDTTTAVIPYTECRFTAVLGWSFAALSNVPQEEPQLNVR